jgi:hypothetical protein
VRFPVRLEFTVKSEEVDETALLPSPIYEFRFEKLTTLPCPPGLGFSVACGGHHLKIRDIILLPQYAICVFEELVIPVARFETGFERFRAGFIEDGWATQSLGSREPVDAYGRSKVG